MIIGERLQLRAIEESDLPMLVKWRNDPDVSRHFFNHEPLSLTAQKRWYEAFQQKDDERYWIAEKRDDSAAVGTVALTGLDWRSRKAELGRVLVHPAEHRRQGYCREMCGLALGYAFDHLNLHRVSLEVFADNEPAIALYRELGFVEEGRFREHTFANGAYRDVLFFSLLSGEFETLNKG